VTAEHRASGTQRTQEQRQTIDRLVEAAHAAVLAGDIDSAIHDLQEVFRLDRGNLKARALFGLCAAIKGDYPVAEQNLNYVLERDRDNAIAQLAQRQLQQRSAAPHPVPPDAGGKTLAGTRPARVAGRLPVPTRMRILANTLVSLAFGAFLGPLLGAAVWDLTAGFHGGRAVDFGAYFFAGPPSFLLSVIGALLMLLVARGRNRKIRQKHGGGEHASGEPRRPAARRAALAGSPVRRRSGFGRGALPVVLWLPLLSAGGALGYWVGSGVGGSEGAGAIGAIFGVIVSQLIQAVAFRRRR
jgi:MFS family permease